MQIRRLFAVLLAAVIVLTLAACGTGSNTQDSSDNTKAQETTAAGTESTDSATASAETSEQPSSDTSDTETAENKILVVYFSWSGHLDSMAHWVADETGGDLYRVTAKDPYPENYNQTADRAKQEQDNNVRPEIVVDITEEQMAQYDTVFFGFALGNASEIRHALQTESHHRFDAACARASRWIL